MGGGIGDHGGMGGGSGSRQKDAKSDASSLDTKLLSSRVEIKKETEIKAKKFLDTHLMRPSYYTSALLILAAKKNKKFFDGELRAQIGISDKLSLSHGIESLVNSGLIDYVHANSYYGYAANSTYQITDLGIEVIKQLKKAQKEEILRYLSIQILKIASRVSALEIAGFVDRSTGSSLKKLLHN